MQRRRSIIASISIAVAACDFDFPNPEGLPIGDNVVDEGSIANDEAFPSEGFEHGTWPPIPRAPKSCTAILDRGLSNGDGLYRIDPDGAGPKPDLEVYCDMTIDGG